MCIKIHYSIIPSATTTFPTYSGLSACRLSYEHSIAIHSQFVSSSGFLVKKFRLGQVHIVTPLWYAKAWNESRKATVDCKTTHYLCNPLLMQVKSFTAPLSFVFLWDGPRFKMQQSTVCRVVQCVGRLPIPHPPSHPRLSPTNERLFPCSTSMAGAT